MISKLTARFENIDLADLAAAKIRSRLDSDISMLGFPISGNAAYTDPEMAELDLLVIPFPAMNSGTFGAAVISGAETATAVQYENYLTQEAALIVTAPRSNIGEINAIIINSGGYFCHIEDIPGSEFNF